MTHTSESTVLPAPRRLHRPGGRSRRALPALTVLAHPNLRRVGDRAVLGELGEHGRAELSRMRPDFRTPGATSPGAHTGAPLADRYLSRRPIELERRGAEWRLACRGVPTPVRVDGAELGEPAGFAVDFADADVERGLVIDIAGRVVLLLHWHLPAPLPEHADHAPGGHRGSESLVGESDGMVLLRREIRGVAGLDVGVLLRGETGTGKELVARALHGLSERRDGPFVAVNLGALPPTLAASELFGAVKGAFTGATRERDGSFARADGGTLFLDEVGEAPAEIQVALLRVLETGELTPLGAPRPRRVDVRIVAATDADLGARIEAGTFREPLLHRLAGYEIELPPLRRRRDDIGRLFVHFLEEHAATLDRAGRDEGEQPWIDAALMTRLARHAWPGNVRQLRNAVRQLVIGNRDRPTLLATPAVERMLSEAPPRQSTSATSSKEASKQASKQAGPGRPATADRRRPAELDDGEILDALRRARFEVKAAAELLGISRGALYLWIEASPDARTAGQLDEEEVRRAHRELDGELDALVDRLGVSRFALRRRLKELGL